MIIGCIIILSILIVFLFVGFLLAWIMHSKLFGRRYTPDPLVRYYTPEEFDLISKEVTFSCGKDKLRGAIYSYKDADVNKIIVFAHGMWSSTRAYMQDIEYLCRAGYYVLGFDYTGTDLSDGKKLKGLAQGVKSLSCAIDFIQKKSDFKNADIYVVGHSWGGFSTLNVIKYHPEIRGIVAMSPFVSIFQLLKGMLPKKLYWLIPFVLGIELISCGRYALVNAKRSLHNYQGKALIVHSKDDPMVNYNLNTEILQKKCLNKKVKYYIVDGKGHNPNYTKEAIQALQEYSLKLRTLSKEEAITYKKSVNFHKLGELDTEVMNDIVNFINE